MTRQPFIPPTIVRNTPDSILESDQADLGAFMEPFMGGSVASAGDVNGDGYDDVIVGAPGWDTPGGFFDEGAAFVFLGGPLGVVDANPSTAHAFIQSNEGASFFGTSVDSAGDVNGDGFDDIIVGAPGFNSSGLGASGAAFVFFGGPLGITATSPADADAVLESKQLSAHMGSSVSCAGDVNGDGFDDVIVGAQRFGQPFVPPIANQGSGVQGAAFVFLGSATGIVGNDPATAHAQLVPWSDGAPPQITALFGSSVASAGDVNGDGYADVIVGSPTFNYALPGAGVDDPSQEGAAFVFLGGPAGIVGHDPSDAHARIEGGLREAFMGNSVASAGDVNADGYTDIIVGAIGFPAGDPYGSTEEGAVFVFLGGPAGITASGTGDAQFMVQGTELAEWIGRSVAPVGDYDQDGYDDVIFGARIFPGSSSNQGVAYLFRGGPGGIVGTSLAHAHTRIVVNTANNYLGWAVAGAGNVDGDQRPDLIIGVPGYTGPEIFEGAAFIFHAVPH